MYWADHFEYCFHELHTCYSSYIPFSSVVSSVPNKFSERSVRQFCKVHVLNRMDEKEFDDVEQTIENVLFILH